MHNVSCGPCRHSVKGVDCTNCSFVLGAVYQVITAFFAHIRSTTLGRLRWAVVQG